MRYAPRYTLFAAVKATVSCHFDSSSRDFLSFWLLSVCFELPYPFRFIISHVTTSLTLPLYLSHSLKRHLLHFSPHSSNRIYLSCFHHSRFHYGNLVEKCLIMLSVSRPLVLHAPPIPPQVFTLNSFTKAHLATDPLSKVSSLFCFLFSLPLYFHFPFCIPCFFFCVSQIKHFSILLLFLTFSLVLSLFQLFPLFLTLILLPSP